MLLPLILPAMNLTPSILKPNSTMINILLIMGIFASFAKGEELYYSMEHGTGFATFLLGTRLVENASYSSHGFTASSVLTDRLRTYLELSHSQIYPFAEYSSSQAEIGLQVRYLEIKDNQLFAGLYGTSSRYHSAYSYYNSALLGSYIKWKHYFKATQLITAGIDLELKRYSDLAEASNTETQVYVRYNHSFKSRTSIQLSTSVGYQDFWPQTVLEGSGVNLVTISEDAIPTNSLFSSGLRVSQSLGAKLGLTFWIEDQILLNDAGGTLLPQDGMNNPFIDAYRWEGPSTSLRMIYRLSKNHNLTCSYNYVEKGFLDVPVYAFDFDGGNYVLVEDAYVDLGMDRADERHSLQLSWRLSHLSTLSEWLPGTDLVLNYGRTENRSNDPIYDYGSDNYSVSIYFNN